MKSNLGHLQVNIQIKNKAFYKDLFNFLGWSVLYEDENIIGVGCEKGASLWFCAGLKDLKNDYDGIGMNHLGVSVDQQSEVDEAVAYLKAQGVSALFETPRHRSEFSGEGSTYYQVMFESPDKILFEIVYTGPKQ